MLERQSGVALLIHDFDDGKEQDSDDDDGNRLTGEYSITLNGNCSVVKDGELFRAYACPRFSYHASLVIPCIRVSCL